MYFLMLYNIILCGCIIIYLTKCSSFSFQFVPNIFPNYNTVVKIFVSSFGVHLYEFL